MKPMDKRACRKFAFPETGFCKTNGLLHLPAIEYVIRAAVKNIGGRRMLLLYLYKASEAAAGKAIPTYTVFQTKDDFLTLERMENGKTRWRKASTDCLKHRGYYAFSIKCAFYSFCDEQTVLRYCGNNCEYGFAALSALQGKIQDSRVRARKLAAERKIADRMKAVPALPRGVHGWIQRELIPHYLFFDNDRKKVGMPGYCTACRKAVTVSGVKHNQQGVCPNCKRAVTFKSRAMRGNLFDRGTAQVIQRLAKNELVIRFVKYTNHIICAEEPDCDIYENARIFLSWKDGDKITEEHYYYRYGGYERTPWRKGDRPVFSVYQYYFEADQCGYLYDRNLDEALQGSPWQYSQLAQYYRSDPTPLTVLTYLWAYCRYPQIEYLVKLGLYRLVTSIVYDNRYPAMKSPINPAGRNLQEVLGVRKAYLPFLQEVNPGLKQLALIQTMLKEGKQPDRALLRWCAEFNVGKSTKVLTPLRYMTVHRFMRYAEDTYARFRSTSPYQPGPGYSSMESLLSDYSDYLLMCEELRYDLKNEFILFPRDLPQAHHAANEETDKRTAEAHNRRIMEDFEKLQQRYHYKNDGLLITAPHCANEIVFEGQKLHHCVGRYVEDVACGKCIILFVREEEHPDEPYCTVELKDGDVYQARIHHNQEPPEKVLRFIDRWKNKVLYIAAAHKAA